MKSYQLIAALGLFALTDAAFAQDAATIIQYEKNIGVQREKLKQAMEQARKAALAAFDKEIAAMKKTTGGNAAIKLDLLERYQKAREEFDNKGNWPNTDEFLKTQLEYAAAINKAYVPVSASYNKIIELCLKANNSEAATRYKKEKADLDDTLPGRKTIAKGARFGGNRYTVGSNNTLQISLNITAENDNTFEGNWHSNPSIPGHDVFEFKASIDGNAVTIQPTKAIRGGLPKLGYAGFVTGGKIILSKTTVDNKGKVTINYYLFSR